MANRGGKVGQDDLSLPHPLPHSADLEEALLIRISVQIEAVAQQEDNCKYFVSQNCQLELVFLILIMQAEV